MVSATESKPAEVGRRGSTGGRTGFIFGCQGKPFPEGSFGKDKKKARGQVTPIWEGGSRLEGTAKELHLKVRASVPGKEAAGGGMRGRG